MTTKPINFNSLTLYEALDLINKDVGMLYTYFRFAENSPLHKVFKSAYLPEFKFLLPEGDPPYTPSKAAVGASSCDLLVAIRKNRFDYFNGTVQLPEVKREQLFINLIETVHPTEAKVLLAIKDQRLDKLFPNITYKVLEIAGYLPARAEPAPEPVVVEQPEVQQGEEQPSKSKRATTRRKTTSGTAKTTTRKARKPVQTENTETEATK